MYDEDINLMIGLRRELKYIDWLSHTFVTSFFYLSFHCAAHTLVILPQSFLLSNNVDSHFNNGVISYVIYFCTILFACAFLILVFFQPIDEGSDLEKPKIVLILHTLHIITHFILSFDWYQELLQIM